MDETVRVARCRLLIDGRWTDGERTEGVLDKYTQEVCAEMAIPSRDQVRQAVSIAHAAYQACGLTAFERGLILDRAADIVMQREDEVLAVLRQEAGFTAADSLAELRRCAQTLRLSAQEARNLSGEMIPLEGAAGQQGRLGFTIRVPLGVVCAITPFNAPLNTVAHKVGPALAAGNAVILKPSEHTPGAAVILAEALLEAGLPQGLLAVLHGGAAVAQWLLDEPLVRFYAFTGSTVVGRHIQKYAGLRRTQMELGSIAFTVLAADADLDAALPKLVNAAYRKAGQVCTSVQTLLVHESIRATVEERLTPMVADLVYGDPAKPDTVVGPLISLAAAQRVEQWIEEARARGARVLAGGARCGAVVPPTLLADVDETLPVSCQEAFGPVMSIVPFASLDEAIDRVNATPYGLATGLFTNRLNEAFAAARRLRVGGVHINETSSSRVDMMPYGGSKDSGFGREGPHYAVREMSEERMVTVRI